jgi:arylformamidase
MARTRIEALPPEAWTGGGWIDVSRPLTPRTPVWPGDRAFELTGGDHGGLLVSAFATTCHVGTHLDAPLHLASDGASVEETPIERILGRAEVVAVRVGGRAALPGDLPRGWVPRDPRVLLRTDSHPVDAPIGAGFTGASEALIHWLADHGVWTLGVDTPSVDVFESVRLEAHHALAGRGMTWIEGLNLAAAAPGRYLLLALPIALVGVEAAPVRALIRPLEHDNQPV